MRALALVAVWVGTLWAAYVGGHIQGQIDCIGDPAPVVGCLYEPNGRYWRQYPVQEHDQISTVEGGWLFMDPCPEKGGIL